MSAGDDGLFARWSRRKQAVRRVDARTSDEAAQAATATAVEAGVEAEADPQLPAPASAATESSEPAPSLEDLTAAGDLSAFLREGVPTALKNAAMRKMWSIDPAIRDHIGLADYAWDFNEPGSMPGFGPLEAGKAVADFLPTMSAAPPIDSETAVTVSEAPPQASAVASGPETSLAPAASDPPRDAPAESPPSAPEAADAADHTDASRASPRPHRGGALPR